MIKKLFTFFAVAITVITVATTTVSEVLKPPLEKTGAPGESYCTDCHSGTPLNGGGGKMILHFNGKNNIYVPGVTYTITVSVTDSAQSDFGCFETTILDESDNAVGTNIITHPNNTLLRHDLNNNRDYVSNFQGIHYTSWSFKWKAPSVNAGKITIYGTTNATNDDFTPMGDHIYARTLVLTPQVIHFLKDRDDDMDGNDQGNVFSVLPTLINESFSVKYVIDAAAHVQISLYNLHGQLEQNFFDGQMETGLYEPKFTLNKEYDAGIYFLVLKMNDETHLQKIVIQ